jgi:hypothetical protein
MFQSPILDVAAGLIVLYLVLSLICTSINEYISQALSLREEILFKALKSLFQNAPDNDKFVKGLCNHNLVDALSAPGAKPSYIPASIFSLALVDCLGIHTDSTVANPSGPAISSLLDAAKAAQAGIEEKYRIDPRIFDTVRPLAIAAGNNMDAFRKNLESWFNSTMQRAGGWYKSRVQVITLLVAFSLALVFNADSLMVTNTLWNNPAQRKLISDSAANLDKAKTLPAADATDIKSAATNLDTFIGWTGPMWNQPATNTKDIHRFPTSFEGWVGKLMGLLITAFAASLGAPFWFGVLGQVMSIRNSGTSPNDKTTQPARIGSTGGDDPPGLHPFSGGN